MNRDEFRNSVFARDKHKCVACGAEAVDAHHLIERRAFSETDPIPYGYDTDNGVSLCAFHHMNAEETLLSAKLLREYAHITRIVLPEQFDADAGDYTKWCDLILTNGERMPGPYFYDESVQKVLAPVLHLYEKHIKYERTFHLPWSKMKTDDDRTLKSVEQFVGKHVTVFTKVDGEHTVMWNDAIYARSREYPAHPSRSRVRALHAQIKWDIPDDMHIHGENMFGKHTIHYHNLTNFFYVHSVWVKDHCLSWPESVEWAQLLGLETCPVLYEGMWDEDLIRGLYTPMFNDDPQEGYVVRVTDGFLRSQFAKNIGKYVEHPISSSNHWYHTQFIANELRKDLR